MKTLYTATATAHGGREGHIHSSDGALDVQLRTPKELGGPGGLGTNPEQLFAAGYAACFESALRLVARTRKVALKDATVSAHVALGKSEDGNFGLSVVLRGKLADVPRDQAEALMQAAHEVCPYSRATRGNLDVTLEVE
ncbi:MAG: organic hydroperoxide resistance protein [Polyangiales bacterium]